MVLRLSMEWLGSCSGCEIAFLNIGENLISLLTQDFEVVHAPLLMDNKYTWEDEGKLRLPQADVGIVTGGVNNEEHLEILLEMRRQCNYLIALGTCATHGGIPALMNSMDQKQCWQEIFQTRGTDSGAAVPDVEVPVPLERVFACDEKVPIDLLVPGCAPNPQIIEEVLRSQMEKRPPVIPGRSVCDTCPVVRKGKGDIARVKRFLENADYNKDEPHSSMRCLLEQGFLCLGPVTLAGCASNGVPSCIAARVPCRGCYGPVRKGGNQMLDMMNAMVSNDIDYKSVIDRRSILRFTGAHGRLRPLKKGS